MVNSEIKIEELSVAFSTKEGLIKAVDDVNIQFKPYTVTAIIGESGCGKSVLGQAILGILPPTVFKEGVIVTKASSTFGIVPQNPADSLNPIRKIYKQFQDILDVHGVQDKRHTLKKECMELFGLEDVERVLNAYPYELSGGMLQRLLCAMAISTKPQWIFADEPTKGLDENTVKIVTENFQRIRKALNCGMIIITHDLEFAKTISDRIVIMYAGQVMEVSSELFTKPMHPYTQAFIKALPENGMKVLEGKNDNLLSNQRGCKFATRCLYRKAKCLEYRPELYSLGNAIQVRCFKYANL
ncbi:MAG: ABC transporter ATP-binding protein [Phascolarctobacterium sp.]|nr:ABC transporter ATP-binding protein [Phascolarctobacterium sp.]